MRNKVLSFILVFSFSFVTIHASIIPDNRAETVAKTAFAMKNKFGKRSVTDQTIVSKFTKEVDGIPSYHIFNFKPQGFVIVSADDTYNPILAFSDESSIDFDNELVNESLFLNLSRHEQRIQYNRKHNAPISDLVKNEWSTLRKVQTEGVAKMEPEGVVVSPLTTTKWNQGQYYNSFCPANSDTANEGPDGGTYAGCSPIAMAQLIKFYNYPPRGNGFNTYEDPDFGPQTVDFCNTEYNWSGMPDSLTTYNDNVAEFIYQVGVSTNTSYSPVYTSTFISYMRDALVFYFGYDESAAWFYDDNDRFREVAIEDLDQGRPTVLTGTSIFGGAHTWIADGYGYFTTPQPNQPAEFFHFNWGWGGDNNGWFLDTGASWDPLPNQPGTENITYYEDRYVVHNVFPSEVECASLDELYMSGVTMSTGYMNASYHYGEQEISFRYRKVGTADWKETDATTNYYQYINNLELGSDYEYQARRKCCGEKWSNYSQSFFFSTEGDEPDVPCVQIRDENLTTSSVSDNFIYVYTSQPYGSASNQFRYKPVDDTDWLYTAREDSYFRFLNNLNPGTTYEFQVSHECQPDQWTDYSESSFFMTTGTPDDGGGGTDCETVNSENLYTSSIGDSYVYLYSSQPYGNVNNRFRYKADSASDWTETDVSNNYYRFLSGLNSGTQFEFQVSHECSTDNWSDWSASEYFTTTGTTGGEGDDCEALGAGSIYTSSTTSSFTYLYTLQPYGNVSNQFRYRPVGGASWTLTDESNNYYRSVGGLASDTEFEFQVRHECSAGNWSDYSASQFFTTLANGPNTISSSSQEWRTDHSKILTYEELELRLMKSFSVEAYPNPVMNVLNVEPSQPFQDNDMIIINDMMGRLIQEFKVNEGDTQARIDFSNMSNGVYFIEISSGDEKTVQKIIKS